MELLAAGRKPKCHCRILAGTGQVAGQDGLRVEGREWTPVGVDVEALGGVREEVRQRPCAIRHQLASRLRGAWAVGGGSAPLAPPWVAVGGAPGEAAVAWFYLGQSSAPQPQLTEASRGREEALRVAAHLVSRHRWTVKYHCGIFSNCVDSVRSVSNCASIGHVYTQSTGTKEESSVGRQLATSPPSYPDLHCGIAGQRLGGVPTYRRRNMSERMSRVLSRPKRRG